VTCALLVAACGQNKVAEKPPEPGDTAVARVNGQVIWASDVKREAVAQGLISEGEPLDISSEVFRQRSTRWSTRSCWPPRPQAQARQGRRGPAPPGRRPRAHPGRHAGRGRRREGRQRGRHPQALRRAAEAFEAQSDEIRARQIVVGSQAEAEAVKKLLAGRRLVRRPGHGALDRRRPPASTAATSATSPRRHARALRRRPEGRPAKGATGRSVPGRGRLGASSRSRTSAPEEPITLEAARPQIVRFLTYDQVRDLLEKLRGGAKVEMLIGKPQDAAGRRPGTGLGPADLPGGAPAPRRPAQPAPSHEVRRLDQDSKDFARKGAAKAPEAAPKPAQAGRIVGQRRDRARARSADLGPEARRPSRPSVAEPRPRRRPSPAPPPGKPGLAISPLAVPFPKSRRSPASRSPPAAPASTSTSARTCC
jgi:peptidyl-prolyl cis-trans isomerase C